VAEAVKQYRPNFLVSSAILSEISNNAISLEIHKKVLADAEMFVSSLNVDPRQAAPTKALTASNRH
jgi:hypothetical protein